MAGIHPREGDPISDIDDKIAEFAKHKRIHPTAFKEFRDNILNGLRKMGLRTDTIELDKFKEIAKRKDAQKLAEQQEVEPCRKPEEKQ